MFTKYFSFNGFLRKLCKKYPKVNKFYIKFFWKRIWILYDKELIKSVLSKEAETKLTFTNKCFFNSHGHFYGIGNIDFFNGPCLWEAIHKSLSQSIDQDKLKALIHTHKHILLGASGFEYIINDILEEYILKIWANFTFGSNVNFMKYKNLRNKILHFLRLTFYQNKFNSIPKFGELWCSLKRIYYYAQLHEINKELRNLLDNNDDNFLNKFKQNLNKYNSENKIFEFELVDKLVIDNAFLSFLVFDFIYNSILESIIDISKKQNYDKNSILNMKKTSIKKTFLFPYRMRYFDKEFEIFKKGDYVIMNLTESDLLFSSGPRSCIGQGFFDIFYKKFYEMLQPFDIKSCDDTDISYSSDDNMPIIISKHKIKFELPKNYLTTVLQSYEYKGIKKFYKVEQITEDPILFNYITFCFEEKIKSLMNFKHIDGIITSEARGFLFASPLIKYFGIPLYLLRKQGKLPGPTIKAEYQKNYGPKEELELSVDSDLKGKNLIFIDDGIASGETSKAILELVKKAEGNIICLLAAIKHTYFQINDINVEIFYIFTL
ncbi:Phosphoribosyltransferase [uncultured virus]|nr:Phosphoribosyltransferase [uncultured virus]